MHRREFLFEAMAGFLGLPLFGNAQKIEPIRLTPPNLERKALSVIDNENPKDIMFGDYHNGIVRDNEFVRKILPALKRRGYEYFAIEIHREPIADSKLNGSLNNYARGKLKREDMSEESLNLIKRLRTGWLDLIDVARRLDMKVVCYDVDGRIGSNLTFSARDKKSLENLNKEIYSKKPEAKVVYYCGAYHVLEKPVFTPLGEHIPIRRHGNIREVEPIRPLACQLREYGRDPLTFAFDIKLEDVVRDAGGNEVLKQTYSTLDICEMPLHVDYVISP